STHGSPQAYSPHTRCAPRTVRPRRIRLTHGLLHATYILTNHHAGNDFLKVIGSYRRHTHFIHIKNGVLMMKKYFEFDRLQTNYKTEFIAGLTTFLAMAYVLFVVPSTLALVGVEDLPDGVTRIDQGAVFTATAIAAAVGSLFMGIIAKYPIVLAPGMGLNAFFAYTVMLGYGIPWEIGLAGALVSGLIFMVLTLTGLREKIINSIPGQLKMAVGAGIGLFIAFIGF